MAVVVLVLGAATGGALWILLLEDGTPGSRVRVLTAGGLAAEDVTVVAGDPINEPPSGSPELAEPVGNAYLLSTDSSRPAAVEVPFDEATLPGPQGEVLLLLAYFDETQDRWVPVPSTVDWERGVVVATTDHLSWWRVFAWTKAALSSIAEAIALPSMAVLQTPAGVAPQCDVVPALVSLEFDDHLLACVEDGGTPGEVVVRIANNRAYPVEARIPDGATVEPSSPSATVADVAADAVSDALPGDTLYLPAGGELAVRYTFTEAGSIEITTEMSAGGLALQPLLTALSLVAPGTQEVIASGDCMAPALVAGNDPQNQDFAALASALHRCANAAVPVWSSVVSFMNLGTALGQLLTEAFSTQGSGHVSITYEGGGTVGWDSTAIWDYEDVPTETCGQRYTEVDGRPLYMVSGTPSEIQCIAETAARSMPAQAIDFLLTHEIMLGCFGAYGVVDIGCVWAPWFNMSRSSPVFLIGRDFFYFSYFLPDGWQSHPGYAALGTQYPDARLWEEYGALDAASTTGDGQQFFVSFPLMVCRACGEVGRLRLSVVFDLYGSAVETELLEPDGTAPAALPISDPFSYCASAETDHDPRLSDTYVGPEAPFDLSNGTGVQWRCWDGTVLGCIEASQGVCDQYPPGRPLGDLDAFGFLVGPWYEITP